MTTYPYKDFLTGKVHATRGEFVSWSEPTGPLHVRYATFKTPKTYVSIPAYCLTKESRAALPPMPREPQP